MPRYNSMFNQWETMSPMPEAVLHPAVAATDQRIYVFGGEDAMQNPVRLIQVIPNALSLISIGISTSHLPIKFTLSPCNFSKGLPHFQKSMVSDGKPNSEECLCTRGCP